MSENFKTERGIFLDLHYSDINVKLKGYTFIFSSKVYARKFKENYKKYIDTERLKLEKRFKSKIVNDDLFLINYYKLIEKRGFLIYYKDNELKSNYKIEIKLI